MNVMKNQRGIYVGDSKNVIKRILTNHCSGNVEASALRRAVAKKIGFKISRVRRPSGSVRIRLDIPNSRKGEDKISEYIRSGKWKYVLCTSKEEARDFQWFVIERINSPLNTDERSWNPSNQSRYEKLYTALQEAPLTHYLQLQGKKSGPGVYVLHNEKLPGAYIFDK